MRLISYAVALALVSISAMACREADVAGPIEAAVAFDTRRSTYGCEDPYLCKRPMSALEEQFAGPKLFEISMLPPSVATMGCINLAYDALEYSFTGSAVVWDSLEVVNPWGWNAITFGNGSSYFGHVGAPVSEIHVHEAVHRRQARFGQPMDEGEAYGVAAGCVSWQGMSLREKLKAAGPSEGRHNGRSQ